MGTLVRSAKNDAPASEVAMAQGRQYLTFLLGGEGFAIPIVAIKEIIQYREPTDVPMMPSFIRGVINLRGHVVPVIDLSLRFGRSRSAVSRRTCIVILEVNHEGQPQDLGMVVDAVSAVLEIPDGDIEPPPAFGAKLRNDFITGMGKIGEKFVVILDVDRVLSVEELSMLGGLQQEAAAPSEPSISAS